MQITILQEELSKALSQSIRFVSTKKTLPILGNFLLEAAKTNLKIKATNLEMSINLKIGSQIEEEGIVTVPARQFIEIINNLNLGQISLKTQKDKLKIESLGFKSQIPTLPANDFPKIPEDIKEEKSFKIKSSLLNEAISKVLISSGVDESRPILTGILFVFKKTSNSSTLSLVASDGFRLSKKDISIEKQPTLPEDKVIIPRGALLELIKNIKNEPEISFEVKKEDNQLLLKAGNMCLATRLIEGNFPEFEKIIPSEFSTKISVGRNDLLKAVKLASVFANEDNVVKLKCNPENNSLVVLSEGKVGEGENKIEAKIIGGSLEISFNYKYLEDFLNICTSESVEINLNDGSSPVVFVDPSDSDLLHLIMPVRIQN